MNLPEQMYSDLKEQLPALQEALKEGAQWGTELAGRYIQYDIAVQVAILCSFLLLLVGNYPMWKIFLKPHRKRMKDSNYYDGSWLAAPIAYSMISAVLSLTIGSDSLGTLLKDIFIPEIRILELLSNLV